MVDFRYRRLSYIAVATPDLDRSHGFLTETLGLADGAESDNAKVRFLRCSDAHHDVMLVAGQEPGLVRIAFEMGLSDKLDLTFARYRGSSVQQKLMEMNLKYLLAQQLEGDPSHPLSVLLFANVVIACSKITG